MKNELVFFMDELNPLDETDFGWEKTKLGTQISMPIEIIEPKKTDKNYKFTCCKLNKEYRYSINTTFIYRDEFPTSKTFSSSDWYFMPDEEFLNQEILSIITKMTKVPADKLKLGDIVVTLEPTFVVLGLYIAFGVVISKIDIYGLTSCGDANHQSISLSKTYLIDVESHKILQFSSNDHKLLNLNHIENKKSRLKRDLDGLFDKKQ